MFKKLHIQDWRQFENIDVEFHPHLTILTGANGAGKTTVLNLLSKHLGWTPQFVSSYEKDKEGILKYFASIKNFGMKIFGGDKNNVTDKCILGEIVFDDGTISKLMLPTNVSSGTYNIQTNNNKLEKGVFINSHRPNFPYRAVQTIPTSIASRKQIFSQYNEFNKVFALDKYRDHDKMTATSLIKETIASLAIFGYGNQSVRANEEAKKLFEGYIEILKIVLPPKLGFQNIEVVVPEVMLSTNTGTFPIDAVSGGISSIIDITWQLYMYSDINDSFVAIIDEPENHLHPELQKNFLGNLIKAFPNVQFVVATHNPFMITSQKDSNVYVLNYNEENKVCSYQLDYINRAGTSNTILREVLGIDSTMPIWAEEMLNNIIGKYSQTTLTVDNLSKLKEELSEIGLSEYIPESIANVVEGSDTDDKN